MKDKTNDGTKAELTTLEQQAARQKEILGGREVLFVIEPKDIISVEGIFIRYKPPTYTYPAQTPAHKQVHNFNECENCLKEIKEIMEKAKLYFEDNTNGRKPFPNCCEPHKRLAAHPEFRIAHFSEAPAMVAQYIVFTKQCIRDYYDTEIWYKAITDYIHYSYGGFGSMPEGGSNPLFWVEYTNEIIHFVESCDELDAEKKARLIEYLLAKIPKQAQPKHLQTKYLQPTKNETGYNQLLSIHQRWLELFPFDLDPYFTDLKNRFKAAPPMFSRIGANLFTTEVQTTFHTPETLMETLIQTTEQLLTVTSGEALYEKGLITDLGIALINITRDKRKLKIKNGYLDVSEGVKLPYVKILEEWFIDEQEYFNNLIIGINNSKPQPPQGKVSNGVVELRVTLKPEVVQVVFDIIKGFFEVEQQSELKQILETGNNSGNKKLLFKDSGNRLTDTFKKLIEHDFITGCQKRYLINWIVSNFEYVKSGESSAFVYKVVEQTISGQKTPCKSPLIEIKNGQIQKVETARVKKHSNY